MRISNLFAIIGGFLLAGCIGFYINISMADSTMVQEVPVIDAAVESGSTENMQSPAPTPVQTDTIVETEVVPDATETEQVVEEAAPTDVVQEQASEEFVVAPSSETVSDAQDEGLLSDDEEEVAAAGGLGALVVTAALAAAKVKTAADATKKAVDSGKELVGKGQALVSSGQELLQGKSLYQRQAQQAELDRQQLVVQKAQEQAAGKVEVYRNASMPDKQASWQTRLNQANQLQANVRRQQEIRTQLETARMTQEQQAEKMAEAERLSKTVSDFERQQAESRLAKYQERPTLTQKEVLKRDAAHIILSKQQPGSAPQSVSVPVADSITDIEKPDKTIGEKYSKYRLRGR